MCDCFVNIATLRTLKNYDYCSQGWKEAKREGRVGGKRTRAVTKKAEHDWFALTLTPLKGGGVR